jgi:tetratricopeptide (TPR) repeat protein
MNIVKLLLLGALGLFTGIPVFAQHVGIEMITDVPHGDTAPKPPVITSASFTDLYNKYPDSVYTEYLHLLLMEKQYKTAEKVVESQKNRTNQDPFLHIDLGDVYAWERKYDKAKLQYDSLLDMLTGDDARTQRIAKAFMDDSNDDYAIRTYERAVNMTNALYYYCMPLARLYDKCGRLDKAIEMVLAGVQTQGGNVETMKAQLLEMLGNDPDKLKQMQRGIVKKINDDPNNVYYAELLTWIYTQKNDWDGALVQIEAVDERNKENGRRLMYLAALAMNAKQYDAAAKAYDDVIVQGKDLPYYLEARSGKLAAVFEGIKNDSVISAPAVAALAKLYDSFLIEYPNRYTTQTAADYAMLEAQYAGNATKAIDILQRAIIEPGIRQNMVCAFKLQMGDYYVLTGQLWDASLTYSQVDKEFKQDVLGEDARFRNARLAYYRGDFVWAQRQLSVLKASTSELIANDALYLSVQITENVDPEDSNTVPLERFAYAGLLLFQNKDREAEALLDSINIAFPKHPLNDDILMARAEIALKHHDYNKALAHLKTIYEKYGKDVLGDDAVFKMAEVYQHNLHQPDHAKHYYEQLIIDYPGSTFIQTARQRLAELNGAVIP